MSREIPLNVSGSVTLNGSGAGQVALGPSIPGTVWYPSGASCLTSTASNVPTFFLYLNTVSPSTFQGGSYTDSNDTAAVSAVTLYPGMTLIGVWTGGDSAAVATMVLSGTLQVPG